MTCGERALELEILPRDFGMIAQVIAKRQMPCLLLAAALAQVHMVRARPLGRLLEEGIDAIELAERDVNVALGPKKLKVGLKRLEARN